MEPNRTKSGLIVPGNIVQPSVIKESAGSESEGTAIPVIDGFPIASKMIMCREVHVIAKVLDGNSTATVIFSLVGATSDDMDANLAATFVTDYHGALSLGRGLLKHATQIPLAQR